MNICYCTVPHTLFSAYFKYIRLKIKTFLYFFVSNMYSTSSSTTLVLTGFLRKLEFPTWYSRRFENSSFFCQQFNLFEPLTNMFTYFRFSILVRHDIQVLCYTKLTGWGIRRLTCRAPKDFFYPLWSNTLGSQFFRPKIC